MRVGEKETSEQAEIVRRYSDLFSRGQLEALRDAEGDASGEQRELLYRLRKTCEGGLVSAALVDGRQTPDLLRYGVGATSREFTSRVVAGFHLSLANAEFWVGAA